MARYPIPRTRCRTEIRVSNSRFIATVAPADTVRAAQDFIRSLREEMPDATHHVYAFKVGYGASISEGMSDAGEPSGTAGPPVLAVLRGRDVGDIVLVVTRYFGGTKLGTGGLVAAYTQAAQAVLDGLETEEKVRRHEFELVVPYAMLEPVRQALAEFDCIVNNERYEADVCLRYLVAEDQAGDLTAALRNLSAGRLSPMPTE